MTDKPIGNENSHPWGDFLKYRFICIKWLRTEKNKNDSQIAEILSMTEKQVYYIIKNMLRNDKNDW